MNRPSFSAAIRLAASGAALAALSLTSGCGHSADELRAETERANRASADANKTREDLEKKTAELDGARVQARDLRLEKSKLEQDLGARSTRVSSLETELAAARANAAQEAERANAAEAAAAQQTALRTQAESDRAAAVARAERSEAESAGAAETASVAQKLGNEAVVARDAAFRTAEDAQSARERAESSERSALQRAEEAERGRGAAEAATRTARDEAEIAKRGEAGANQRATDLDTQFKAEQTRATNLQSSLSQAQSALEGSQTRVRELEAEVARLRGRNGELEANVASAQQRGDQASAELAQAKSENLARTRELAQAQAESARRETRVAELASATDESKGRAQRLEEELQTARRGTREASDRLVAREREIEERGAGLRLLAHAGNALSREPHLALALALEGARLAPGPLANDTLLLALEATKSLSLPAFEEGALERAELSADGARALLVGEDSAELLRTPLEADAARELDLAPVAAASLAPDGARLATVGAAGEVRLWSTGDGALLFALDEGRGTFRSARFDPSGTRLFTIGKDGGLRSWNATNGQMLASAAPLESTPTAFRWAPDGRSVAIGCSDGTTRIWEPANGVSSAKLAGGGAVVALDFDERAEHLASLDAGGVVRCWKIAGAELERTSAPAEGVVGICFAPDASGVLRAFADGRATFLPARGEDAERELVRCSSGVAALALNAKGDRAALGLLDGRVCVLALPSGEEWLTLRSHAAAIAALAFTRNGERILSADRSGVALFWPVAPQESGAAKGARELSAEERLRYTGTE